MSYFYYLNLAILAAALGLSLYALGRGPGILNRTIALDMLTAITVGGICLFSAWQGTNDTQAIILVLTLISFLTATSVARIVGQQAHAISANPEVARDLKQHLAQKGDQHE